MGNELAPEFIITPFGVLTGGQAWEAPIAPNGTSSAKQMALFAPTTGDPAPVAVRALNPPQAFLTGDPALVDDQALVVDGESMSTVIGRAITLFVFLAHCQARVADGKAVNIVFERAIILFAFLARGQDQVANGEPISIVLGRAIILFVFMARCQARVVDGKPINVVFEKAITLFDCLARDQVADEVLISTSFGKAITQFVVLARGQARGADVEPISIVFRRAIILFAFLADV